MQTYTEAAIMTASAWRLKEICVELQAKVPLGASKAIMQRELCRALGFDAPEGVRRPARQLAAATIVHVSPEAQYSDDVKTTRESCVPTGRQRVYEVYAFGRTYYVAAQQNADALVKVARAFGIGAVVSK